MQEEQTEEDQGAQWYDGHGDDGPNPEEMVADYLPEQRDYLPKTNLELNDPGRVAALLVLSDLYPEVEDLDGPIKDFVQHFIKGRISVDGESRDEFSDILMAMYGGSPDQEDNIGDQLAKAFGAGEEE